MAKMYTLTEAQEQLGINPKTFRRWLEKASIDPGAQISHLDNRIKYLTEEQVNKLAHDHGVDIHAPKAKAAESIPPGAYKLLQEHLDGLENTIGELRLDIPSRSELADLHALLTSALERITTLEEQLTQTQETIATLQAPKRATKAKSMPVSTNELPEGLIPWRPFANEHHAPQTTVYRYIGNGLIHVERGKWRVGNGYVTELLDDKGRHDFWVQLHTNESFIPCNDCPHEIEAGTRQEQDGNEAGTEQQ